MICGFEFVRLTIKFRCRTALRVAVVPRQTRRMIRVILGMSPMIVCDDNVVSGLSFRSSRTPSCRTDQESEQEKQVIEKGFLLQLWYPSLSKKLTIDGKLAGERSEQLLEAWGLCEANNSCSCQQLAVKLKRTHFAHV